MGEAMTVTVRLDEETETRLRRLLVEKGGSLSSFVRAAILEKLEREGKKPTPYELGKHLFGRFKSGKGDLALNHKKYYREAMRAKHRR
jgi:Arc/MetJ-type ribon-helix-helix transcriptional regulator